MKKINKIICNLYILPLVWVLYLLTNLFGTLRYFYIVKYNGGDRVLRLLLSGIWKSSNIIIVILLVIIAFWVKDLLDGKLSKKNILSINILGLFSFVTFFLSQYLITLEKNNFNNYLYSNYGLLIGDVQTLNTVSLFIFIIYLAYLFYRKSSWNNKKNMFSVQRISILVCLSILIINAFIPFLKIKEYFSNMNLDYHKQFSDFSYINELKEAVPNDQYIILPQQTWDWAVIGNLPIVRYFLFPRVLISSDYVTQENLKNEIKVAYFPILENKNINIFWPIIDFNNKTIMFKENSYMDYDRLLLVTENNFIKVYKIVF